MIHQLFRATFGVLLIGSLLTGCDKDRDEGETNEEELITTMKLIFTPVGGGSALTFQVKDVDGPGGVSPVKDDIVLAPSKSYNVSVQLLDETKSPAEDITTEVKAESAAHRFYYTVAAGSNITVSGLDTDAGGLPLGITSTWAAGVAATGKITITLRHYGGNPPGKAANDEVNSSKSGTDIEAEFVTKIQ